MGEAFFTGRFVDFRGLLDAAGDRSEIDPASFILVRCMPDGRYSDPIPWRYLPEEMELIWPVAAGNAGKKAHYRLYFSTSAVSPDWSRSALPMRPNLLPAGDCESERQFWKGSGRLDSTVRYKGRQALRIKGVTRIGKTDQNPKGIPIRPNDLYRISFFIKSEGRVLQSIFVSFSDNHGRLINRTNYGRYCERIGIKSRRGKSHFDWTPVGFSVISPPKASTMEIVIAARQNIQGGKGQLWVDEIQIEPEQLAEAKRIVSTRFNREYHLVDCPDGFLCFDFGPGDSKRMEGFVGVGEKTIYQKDRDFGFLKKGCKAEERIYPDPLARDFVRIPPGQQASFRMDLPDGPYAAWILSGSNPKRHFDRLSSYTIRATGGDSLDVTITPENFNRSFLYRPYFQYITGKDGLPLDIYETYLRPMYKEKTIQAFSNQNHLLIDVSVAQSPNRRQDTGGFLNAMVVYPKNRSAEGRRFIDRLSRKRRARGHIRYLDPNDSSGGIQPSTDDLNRGYLLFQRPFSETMRPGTCPGPHDRLDSIRMTALAGEWKPVSFAVYPLETLGTTRVTVKDLIGPGGKRISKEGIKISVVCYLPVREQALPADYAIHGYRLEGWPVVDKDHIVIQKGVSRRFIITVEPQASLPGGQYRGMVCISPEHGQASELPFTVEVVPLSLIPPKEWRASFWYHLPSAYTRFPFPEMAGAAHHMRVLELRQQLRFRQTTAHFQADFHFWKDGNRIRPLPSCFPKKEKRYVYQPDRLDDVVRMIDRALVAFGEVGIKEVPIFWNTLTWRYIHTSPAFQDALAKDMMCFFDELFHERLKNRPFDFIIDLRGEWSNDKEKGGRGGGDLHKRLRDNFPEFKTSTTINGEYGFKYIPGHCHYIGLRHYMLTDDKTETVRQKGGTPYLYGYTDRFLNGLFVWRTGAKGNLRTEYYLRNYSGQPFNDFDTPIADLTWVSAFHTPNGPVPLTRLYMRAAGFLDALVFYTLDALIEKGLHSERTTVVKTAENAKQFASALKASVPDDFLRMSDEAGLLSDAELNRVRNIALIKAYALQQALHSGKAHSK